MQGFFRFLVWVVVIFAAICGLLYLTVFDVWVIPTDDKMMAVSIMPNMNAGDTVLVFKHGEVADGQLARCIDPGEPLRFVAARVEGQSGETIQITRMRVTLDNKAAAIPRACTPGRARNPGTGSEVEFSCGEEETGSSEHDIWFEKEIEEGESAKTKVSPGAVYLVSDNRHLHVDSRDYGEIPVEKCHRIVFRLWSAQGWFDSKHRNTVLW